VLDEDHADDADDDRNLAAPTAQIVEPSLRKVGGGRIKQVLMSSSAGRFAW
jgi:hypothetical protein